MFLIPGGGKHKEVRAGRGRGSYRLPGAPGSARPGCQRPLPLRRVHPEAIAPPSPLAQLEQARKDVAFWKAELEDTVAEKNQWREKFISAQKQLREVEHLRRQVLQLREDKFHTGKQYDRAIQELQRLRAQLRDVQASQLWRRAWRAALLPGARALRDPRPMLHPQQRRPPPPRPAGR
jgi:hypothetical protein